MSSLREKEVAKSIDAACTVSTYYSAFVEPFTSASGRSISPLQSGAWRCFDIAVASAVLLAVAPFLLFIAAVLFVTDPGPIFFAHRRIGLGGRYFYCLKFRSMKVNADAILRDHLSADPEARREWDATYKLRDDPRITPIGMLLRKLSFDEFPQLLNVLAGDMSIVGPRPIVDAEVPRYGRYIRHYCRVRPGLTGLWQTSGRSDTSYRRRVAMDVSYIERKSIAFDAWLLCKTVPAVVFARGSY